MKRLCLGLRKPKESSTALVQDKAHGCRELHRRAPSEVRLACDMRVTRQAPAVYLRRLERTVRLTNR